MIESILKGILYIFLTIIYISIHYWYIVLLIMILFALFLYFLDYKDSLSVPFIINSEEKKEYKPTKFTESNRYYSKSDNCNHKFNVYYNVKGGEKRKCSKCGKIDNSYYIPPH